MKPIQPETKRFLKGLGIFSFCAVTSFVGAQKSSTLLISNSTLRTGALSAQEQFKTQSQIYSMIHGALGVRVPHMQFSSAFAAGEGGGGGESVGDSSCEIALSAAQEKCSTIWQAGYAEGGYEHGALKYFNGTLCYLNDRFGANIENILCHFTKSMGMKPDINALPVSVTKEFGPKSIVLDAVVPTEAWALAAGYVVKASVTVSGNHYMDLYWKGNGESSAGYLVESAHGFGNKNVSYARWDLTDSTAQVFQLMQCNFETTPLTDAASDRCTYGRTRFDATDSAVSSQVVMIEAQRAGGVSTSFGCFKMFASGTKGGSMFVAKTKNSLGGTGHAVSSTSVNYTDMDAVVGIPDARDTANGTYNVSDSQLATGSPITIEGVSNVDLQTPRDSIAFDKSCNDVNVSVSTGGIFAVGDGAYVDFDLAPSDIFPAIE